MGSCSGFKDTRPETVFRRFSCTRTADAGTNAILIFVSTDPDFRTRAGTVLECARRWRIELGHFSAGICNSIRQRPSPHRHRPDCWHDIPSSFFFRSRPGDVDRMSGRTSGRWKKSRGARRHRILPASSTGEIGGGGVVCGIQRRLPPIPDPSPARGEGRNDQLFPWFFELWRYRWRGVGGDRQSNVAPRSDSSKAALTGLLSACEPCARPGGARSPARRAVFRRRGVL